MFDNAGKNKVAAILAPVGLIIGLSGNAAGRWNEYVCDQWFR